MFDDVTQSAKVKFDRVLVVHDASIDAEPYFTALRARFMVRGANTCDEAAHLARTVDTACIIGVVGGVVTARPLLELLAPFADRLLLVRTASALPDDDVFMLTTATPWLPSSAPASDLVERVAQIIAAHPR